MAQTYSGTTPKQKSPRAHPRKPHPDAILAESDYVGGVGAPSTEREAAWVSGLRCASRESPWMGVTRSEAKRRGGRPGPLTSTAAQKFDPCFDLTEIHSPRRSFCGGATWFSVPTFDHPRERT